MESRVQRITHTSTQMKDSKRVGAITKKVYHPDVPFADMLAEEQRKLEVEEHGRLQRLHKTTS